MDIAFAGTSALEIIRQVRRNPRLELVHAGPLDPDSFRSAYGRIEQLNFSALGLSAPPTGSHPACIRVPSKAERKRSRHIRCLIFPATIPAHSIFQLKRTTATSETGIPTFEGQEMFGGHESLGHHGQAGESEPRSKRKHSGVGVVDRHEPNRSTSHAYRGQFSGQSFLDESELFDGHRVFVDSGPLACATTAAQCLRLIRKGALSQADAIVRLVELIMELTGHYSRDPTDPRRGTVVENLPAFSTIGEFQLFVEQSRHVPGVGLLSKALHYARNGSRSAMETCVWITLTLPERYGLYGFANGKLNAAIVPRESQRALMQHRTLTPDILWERERVAIEYQGFEEHRSRAARTEDNRRANDYQVCGIIALFVTFDDIKSVAACDRLAEKIARLMAVHGMRGEDRRIENLLGDGALRQQRARILANLLPPVNR